MVQVDVKQYWQDQLKIAPYVVLIGVIVALLLRFLMPASLIYLSIVVALAVLYFVVEFRVWLNIPQMSFYSILFIALALRLTVQRIFHPGEYSLAEELILELQILAVFLATLCLLRITFRAQLLKRLRISATQL